MRGGWFLSGAKDAEKRISAVCTAFLLLAPPAWSEPIYKYRMPGGSILYTQAHQKQGRLLKVMQVPGPSARHAALAAQRVEQEKTKADELAAQRRETEAAQNNLHLAMMGLAHTKTVLQTQYAPEPGVVIYPGYFDGSGGPYWHYRHHGGKASGRSHHWAAPGAGNIALAPSWPAAGFLARRRAGP